MTERLHAMWRRGWIVPVLLGSIAFIVRAIGVGRSYELWIDEMVYSEASHSVSAGHLPRIAGNIFLLHPPGAFLLNGAIGRIFGISGTDMSMVYEFRWVNVVLGALTVVLVYLLARTIAGNWIGIGCALLVAFDPFILRNNGRVFLETPATLWVVAGWLVLTRVASTRPRLVSLVGAGLLFGLGFLTKDALIVCSVPAVLLAAVRRQTLRRRDSVVVAASAMVPYLIYLLVLAGNGLLHAWVSSKQQGFRRMVGLTQTTGFNAPGAPSLADRLVEQVTHFGTSYVLLALCPIAGTIASRSANPARRLLGINGIVMGVFAIYTAAFGTLEEQYGYPVLVASVMACSAAAPEVLAWRPRWDRAMAASVTTLLALAVLLGVQTRMVTDNGYQRASAWVRLNLPVNAKLGITNATGEWAFADDARVGVWTSPHSLADNHVNYILTQNLLTREGYGYATPETLTWLQRYAQPVFTVRGPSSGEMVIWHLPDSLLDQVRGATGRYPVVQVKVGKSRLSEHSFLRR